MFWFLKKVFLQTIDIYIYIYIYICMWVIIYHIASMWILTPINIYKQNMWGIYIGSMWILTIIQEKKKEKKEKKRES